MNTSLVKTKPPGDFVRISFLMKDCQTKLETLVSENRAILYDMYPQLALPPELQSRLKQSGYCDLVIENDRWQHCLVPSPN